MKMFVRKDLKTNIKKMFCCLKLGAVRYLLRFHYMFSFVLCLCLFAVFVLCFDSSFGATDPKVMHDTPDTFSTRENEGIERTIGHTRPGIPNVIKNLLSKYKPIEESADTFYGSRQADIALYKACGGWNGTHFGNPTDCPFTKMSITQRTSEISLGNSTVNIVIPTKRDLDFLEHWRNFIQKYHFIIIQDGDPNRSLYIPNWVDYELYNRIDIENALGKERSWAISSRDASIRNFGFLVSKSTYVITIDDDCLPALDANGEEIDAIEGHIRNLQTTSTLFFFNTLYDPYKEGSDFVRGYPYSMRAGVPTAISNGLWLNSPDYDAPTQLLKPFERNKNLAEITLTVPAGVFYPLSSMNVAFNRELIGPAFMQGLMGEGQPWVRYDDMFAGLASKVIADHLGFGVKSGAPYINHNKAPNPFANLMKEYKGLFWQEDIIRFFKSIRFPKYLKTANACYRELSRMILLGLGQLSPYFSRLSKAMNLWVDFWEETQKGLIFFKPSRKSEEKFLPLKVNKSFMESGQCMTYEQRYRKCLEMRHWKNTDLVKEFRLAFSAAAATEVVLIRVGKDIWTRDYWLNICSFLLESTFKQNRHAFLFVMQEHVSAVPLEFKFLIRTHDENDLRRHFTNNIYINGWSHGDLAAAWWLKYNPQYEFAWMFESDVRFAGHWGRFLTHSKRYADARKTSFGDLPLRNSNTNADLIFWDKSAKRLKPNNSTTWWDSLRYMHGDWKNVYPQYPVGIQLMGMGLSKQLGQKLFDAASNGNSNDHQEFNTPTLAAMNYMKITFVPVYTEYHCCSQGAKPVYMNWVQNKSHCELNKLFHPIKSLPEYSPVLGR